MIKQKLPFLPKELKEQNNMARIEWKNINLNSFSEKIRDSLLKKRL
jgi:hypothetical protein